MERVWAVFQDTQDPPVIQVVREVKKKKNVFNEQNTHFKKHKILYSIIEFPFYIILEKQIWNNLCLCLTFNVQLILLLKKKYC